MNVIMTTSNEIAHTKRPQTSSSSSRIVRQHPKSAYIHDLSSPPSRSLMTPSKTTPKPNPLKLKSSSLSSSTSSLCRLPPSIESALLALSSASSTTDDDKATFIILENLKEWPYCPRKRRLEMCDSDIISVPLSKKWQEIASSSFSSLFDDDDDTDTEDVNGCYSEPEDATTTCDEGIHSVNDGVNNHKRRRCAHISDELVVPSTTSDSNSVCSSDGSKLSHSSFPRAA